jgi:hypothetical protein
MEQDRRMIPKENNFLMGASGRLILEEEARRIEEFCGLRPRKPIAREAKKAVTQVLEPPVGGVSNDGM